MSNGRLGSIGGCSVPETEFILREEEGLKTYLSDIHITAPPGPPAGQDVQVWYRNAQQEVRERKYPYITIDLIDISESQEQGRHNNGRVKLSRLAYAPPGPVLQEIADHQYLAERPMPVNLDFQITSHARYARHDRALWGALLRKFPGRWGALAIPGDGTARSMFLLATAGDAEVGENQQQRLFRRIFTVRVLSELWPADIRSVHNLTNATFTLTLPFDVSLIVSELDCHDPY